MPLIDFWKFVSDYADLASIAGFVFSLIGFTWTIVTARAAWKAAERAQESIARVRSQLVANDLGAVIRSVSDLHQALRNKHWEKATRSCEDAQIQLSRNSLNANTVELALS